MALDGRTLTVECPCAGTPHEADTVTFAGTLSLAGGVAGVKAIRDGLRASGGAVDNLALAEFVFPVYLAHAVETWTFTDPDGEPLPLSAGESLPFITKYEIADAADDLFGEEITRPLLLMMQKSSRTGPTGSSISASPASGPTPPEPSEPSSPASSAGETSEE